ncbi:type II toxin-antitoxin system RelE/ParE family toxin [Herbiconiux sp. VKM Ac-1786]|uniref:type II toxin-antitoxin system RelE/ParE family toxin n=1 Tax=Herbiconiux sp. VKM Ac-1786 TaxID=2783824 RepID=UPI00188BF409|nr:type II toxin-antitoxin system RelE/ParE family toxin [Herbiconiux sp. VKM Ac-1786]
MTRRVVTTARAGEDIASAVDAYVSEGAADVALDLVDELEKLRGLLAEFPSLGSARLAIELGIAEIRSAPLGRFPYVAIYTDDSDAVRIHRVLHTRRDLPREFASD